jgi:hypothetical protein
LWSRNEKEPNPQEVKDKKIDFVIIYHNRHKEIKFSLTALKSLRSFSACRGYERLNISGYMDCHAETIYTGAHDNYTYRRAPYKQCNMHEIKRRA